VIVLLILFAILAIIIYLQTEIQKANRTKATEIFKKTYIKPSTKPIGIKLQVQLKREHENLRRINDRVLKLKTNTGDERKLKKWQDRAEELLNEFNLTDWKFYWMNYKTTCGLCYNQLQVISLSRFFVLHCTSNAEIEDTIRHEIGHALCDISEGHGKNWKAMAKVVGYKPVRCASSAVIPKHAKRKFIGICPGNHKHVKHGFKSPAKTNSCTLCDPDYNPNHIIQWQEVSN